MPRSAARFIGGRAVAALLIFNFALLTYRDSSSLDQLRQTVESQQGAGRGGDAHARQGRPRSRAPRAIARREGEALAVAGARRGDGGDAAGRLGAPLRMERPHACTSSARARPRRTSSRGSKRRRYLRNAKSLASDNRVDAQGYQAFDMTAEREFPKTKVAAAAPASPTVRANPRLPGAVPPGARMPFPHRPGMPPGMPGMMPPGMAPNGVAPRAAPGAVPNAASNSASGDDSDDDDSDDGTPAANAKPMPPRPLPPGIHRPVPLHPQKTPGPHHETARAPREEDRRRRHPGGDAGRGVVRAHRSRDRGLHRRAEERSDLLATYQRNERVLGGISTWREQADDQTATASQYGIVAPTKVLAAENLKQRVQPSGEHGRRHGFQRVGASRRAGKLGARACRHAAYNESTLQEPDPARK